MNARLAIQFRRSFAKLDILAVMSVSNAQIRRFELRAMVAEEEALYLER